MDKCDKEGMVSHIKGRFQPVHLAAINYSYVTYPSCIISIFCTHGLLGLFSRRLAAVLPEEDLFPLGAIPDFELAKTQEPSPERVYSVESVRYRSKECSLQALIKEQTGRACGY